MQLKKLILSSVKSPSKGLSKELEHGEKLLVLWEILVSLFALHSQLHLALFLVFYMTMQVFVSETCARPRRHIDFALRRPLKDSDSGDKAYEQPESTCYLQRASYFPIYQG